MLFTEILIEYGIALGAALIFLVILPRWNRKIGSDSLAAWLIVSFVLQAMMWFAAVFTCVINPIRVNLQKIK